jgi:hypothetical protein
MHPAYDSHPHRVTNTKCRIDTVISPDDGLIIARNMQRKEINILRKIVHQVDFIYKIYKNARSTKHKKTAYLSTITVIRQQTQKA